MWFTRVSIANPVMAVMVMFAFVVLGLFSYQRLKVDQFPEIEFPTVVVQIDYPGAAPEVVESEVTRKVEEAVNTIAGINQLYSRSYETSSVVIVQFNLDVDGRRAADDVREKLAIVKAGFRDEVKEPRVSRFDPAARPVFSLALTSPDGSQSMQTLTTYADQVVKKRLENVRGVGSVTLVGGLKREINIYLKPQAMEAFGVGVDAVMAAVRTENQDLPAGALRGRELERTVQIVGRIPRPEALGQIVVARRNGQPVRLAQVADVVDGPEEVESLALYNGQRTLALEVQKSQGENTIEVVDGLQAAAKAIRPQLPQGMALEVVRDNARPIRVSVANVQRTLVEGALLTIGIVFLFLNSWRSTVITGLTLPIALIGTFLFMYVFGFTINTITLMALSLCVGLLIDDAIVVRENIVRHAEMGKDHVRAAKEGTDEIGLAVLATTFSIIAVFVPVAFMGGIIGRFFFQFGITISVAVLLSLFVSFTLDPMMSSVWPEPHHQDPSKRNFFMRAVASFNVAFDRMSVGYRAIIEWALAHRIATVIATTLIFVATLGLGPLVGFSFFPETDRGEFIVMLRTPVGSSLTYTESKTREILHRIHEDKDIAYTYSTIGAGATGTVTEGQIYVKLRSKKERSRSIFKIRPDVRERIAQLVDVSTSVVDAGGVGGPQSPLQISVKGPELSQLDTISKQVLATVQATQGAVDVQISQENTKPELRLSIDRQRAADLGVSVAEIATTLRVLVAGDLAGNFEDKNAETYNIRVRLPSTGRTSQKDVARLFVPGAMRAEGGRTLVALDQVANLSRGVGPSKINRIDLAREVRITGGVEGRPLGDVSTDIKNAVAKLELPSGYVVDLGGQSKDLKETVGYFMETLFLAIVFIYLVLASQFESFLQPLAIMLSLPLSLIGVFAAMLVSRGTMNMMSMIGLIMLMGLVTKNAILLIDNANQRRAEGLGREEALIAAGEIRLRPILMTTLAMIFGMLPLALALGEGSEFRSPMARAVIGGLISSTVLTLVVVPVVYTYLDSLGLYFSRKFGGSTEPHTPGHPHLPHIPAEPVVELTPLPMARPLSQSELAIIRDGDSLHK